MTNATTMSTDASNDEYQAFQIALQDYLGIVIGDESRGHIEGRLQPIMLRESLARLSDVAVALREDTPAHIRTEVLEAITTHNAGWFRYDDIYRLISAYVIPSLIDKQATDCRIWYPGCGYGQGAYSLAMVVSDCLQELSSTMSVEIIATDASQDAVDYAATCRFNSSEIADMPEHYRQKYMQQDGEQIKVDDAICNMLHFKRCDLLSEAADQGHFDVLISPDLLMYFSPGLKRQILDDYANLLDPSGILIVNTNEPVLPYCDRFELVEHEIATFYRQKD